MADSIRALELRMMHRVAWPGLALESAGTKQQVLGTHRIVSPSVTIARFLPYLAGLGITRVADVTGMDCIGIPTVIVVRPNARSLSVSQGKGIDLDAAKASGIMESVEQYHAEHVDRALRLATADDLNRTQRTLDFQRLPRFVRDFSARVRTLWIEGRDLFSGEARWVPYELVNLDFTLPLPEGSGYFTSGSNGLASGNHLLEALSHGLCEVVERDALTLFYHTPAEQQGQRRLDLTSVPSGPCAELLAKYECAAIDVAVWDATSDVGIPTFLCQILERPEECFRVIGMARGSGCHPDPQVALSRALCEAAQSRLTRIVGSRDDMQREHIDELRSERRTAEQRAVMARAPQTTFATLGAYSPVTLEEDVGWILDCLARAGLSEAIAVDLSRPDLPGFVAKVVVPGLEGVSGTRGFRGGARLQAHRQRFARS
jgi:YcaO-like protein with predicted kinase domain